MKKILILALFTPLSIFAQKAKNTAINTATSPIAFTINWVQGDSLQFDDFVIKTDTSVILFEPIIRADLGKAFFNEVQKTDTFSLSRKLGVVEFYATTFNLQGWKDYKKNLNATRLNDPILNESDKKAKEADKAKKQRQDYFDAIKNNKT
jgi:hypothetical protein